MVIIVTHWPVLYLGGARSLRRIVVVHARVCCAQISRTQRGVDAGMLSRPPHRKTGETGHNLKTRRYIIFREYISRNLLNCWQYAKSEINILFRVYRVAVLKQSVLEIATDFLTFLSHMWCWRRMEKISWTDHVRNEEVLLRVNEQRNILHEIRKRKANWIDHILRRNCFLKQVIEGKIKGEMEVTRRRKKLLDDLKDRRGYSHLKEEALDRTMWRNRFGGGFGPVVKQNTEWMMNVSWRL